MTAESAPDSRTHTAIAELKSAIRAVYPWALFSLVPAVDEPGNYDLLVMVEGADPDAVGDLVVERVVEMRVEESIPIHVIPLDRSERGAETGTPKAQHAG